MLLEIYLVNVSETGKEQSIFLQCSQKKKFSIHNMKKLTILHGKSKFILITCSFKQRISHIQNCSVASNNSTLNVDHLLALFQSGRSATVIDESFVIAE